MDKKADSKITVLELVGARRLGCRLGHGLNLDRLDLKDFDLILHTAENFLNLKTLFREWIDLIREFREKHKNLFLKRPDMIRKLVEEADRILKETVLSPNPFSAYNQFLEELTKKKMGPLREELVNDMTLVAKEVSLLKNAVGM